MNHPLTDETCDSIAPWSIQSPCGYTNIRAGADWQLEQVIKWLEFDYQTDPNLSREAKQRGGFKVIAIALEKAMRPQEDNQL